MTMMAGELWLMSYTASLPMAEVKMVFMCNRGNNRWTAANWWKKWEGFFSYKLWWWRMKADCVCGRAFWQQISTQPSTNFTPTAQDLTRVRHIFSDWFVLDVVAAASSATDERNWNVFASLTREKIVIDLEHHVQHTSSDRWADVKVISATRS